MEYYNIEDEKDHAQQERQFQLHHRKYQGWCRTLTHAHLSQERGRPQGQTLKIAGQIWGYPGGREVAYKGHKGQHNRKMKTI